MTETQAAIKTVICPACGLVNLEKFVTFPHCAGCGALISEVPAHTPISFWHQPLRAPLWVGAIAFCCAGLGVLGINIARETAISEDRPLIVIAQRARTMTVGASTTLQFTLDTLAGAPETNVNQFSDVQIRTSLSLTDGFDVLGISPVPTRITSSPVGEIMEFGVLDREEPIRLVLRPRRAGQHRIGVSVFVQDFMPFQFRSTIQVLPSLTAPRPRISAPKMTKLGKGEKSNVQR